MEILTSAVVGTPVQAVKHTRRLIRDLRQNLCHHVQSWRVALSTLSFGHTHTALLARGEPEQQGWLTCSLCSAHWEWVCQD